MKRLELVLTLAAASCFGHATVAAEWHHAAAPMGQFEGSIALDNGATISYGCAGFFSRVGFTIPGKHSGTGTITVDGNKVVDVSFGPSYDGKDTSFEFYAKQERGRDSINELNRVIEAIAQGSELTVRQGDEVLQTWSLNGSSRISSCRYTF